MGNIRLPLYTGSRSTMFIPMHVDRSTRTECAPALSFYASMHDSLAAKIAEATQFSSALSAKLKIPQSLLLASPLQCCRRIHSLDKEIGGLALPCRYARDQFHDIKRISTIALSFGEAIMSFLLSRPLWRARGRRKYRTDKRFAYFAKFPHAEYGMGPPG